ncbi:MAG: hypothetical protein HZA50_05470 [Planctomycetes bacterium]|nr:hypothetical protein [Planctomycetota bacterium]
MPSEAKLVEKVSDFSRRETPEEFLSTPRVSSAPAGAEWDNGHFPRIPRRAASPLRRSIRGYNPPPLRGGMGMAFSLDGRPGRWTWLIAPAAMTRFAETSPVSSRLI